jgi:hypothetical protein
MDDINIAQYNDAGSAELSVVTLSQMIVGENM